MEGQARFKLVAGHAALEFVNTLDDVHAASGPVELIQTYENLLRFGEEAEVVSSKTAKKLRHETSANEQTASLREAYKLRDCFGAIFTAVAQRGEVDTNAILCLNQFLNEALMHRTLAVADGKVGWAWKAEQLNAHAPVWMLTLQGADLLASDELALVKACANQSCRWLFLDTSKNHKRRWCDMQLCGNRAKARGHYQRSSKKSADSAKHQLP